MPEDVFNPVKLVHSMIGILESASCVHGIAPNVITFSNVLYVPITAPPLGWVKLMTVAPLLLLPPVLTVHMTTWKSLMMSAFAHRISCIKIEQQENALILLAHSMRF